MHAYFTLNPNFDLVRKHYYKQATDEEWNEAVNTFIEGGSIYQLDLIYTEEERIQFEETFRSILKKHDLLDHYDTLLYICIHLYEQNWDINGDWQKEYESEKRTVQLAKLLQFYQNANEERSIDISFKMGSNKIKVDDKLLAHWIGEVLTQAVKKKSIPLGFGQFAMASFNQELTPGLIDVLAEHEPKNPRSKYNNAVAWFSICLYQYIQHETTLSSEDEMVFLDSQVHFLWDICDLLGMVKSSTITSEPKDYMRSLIVQYIKRNTIS